MNSSFTDDNQQISILLHFFGQYNFKINPKLKTSKHIQQYDIKQMEYKNLNYKIMKMTVQLIKITIY